MSIRRLVAKVLAPKGGAAQTASHRISLPKFVRAQRTSRQKPLVPILVAGLLLPLAACSRNETPPPIEETVAAPIEPDREYPPEPVEPTPTEPPDKAWPLTGVPTYEIADRPALILKVENSNAARPQQGLEYADIVYEQVVEGGITRFVAVFDSQLPNTVYPVRSARGSDIGLVLPLGGVFGYSGANRRFVTQINNAGIQSLTYDNRNVGFSRISGRAAPHNIAADPNALLAQANSSRLAPAPAQQVFAATAEESSLVSGQPAEHIRASMSNNQTTNWAWNPVIGKYERSDGAAPSMTVSGGQIAATNVILLSVQMTIVQGITDGAGTPVPEVILTGSGRAAFASGGKYLEGTWVKDSNTAPFQFLDSAGNEIKFAPGSTWVQLVPNTRSWSIY